MGVGRGGDGDVMGGGGGMSAMYRWRSRYTERNARSDQYLTPQQQQDK